MLTIFYDTQFWVVRFPRGSVVEFFGVNNIAIFLGKAYSSFLVLSWSCGQNA